MNTSTVDPGRVSWVPWSDFEPELQFPDPAEDLRPLNQRPGHGGPGNQVHAAGGFAPAAAARTHEDVQVHSARILATWGFHSSSETCAGTSMWPTLNLL